MAAFNFPNSPSTNDLHTENGVTYKWNGTVWKRQNASYTDATNLNVTGIATFVNNVSIGGVLTYEDVKNVDSIGIVTARGGLNVTANTDTDTLNVSGISTLGSPSANNTTFINSSTAANSEATTLVVGHGSGNYAGMTFQCAANYPGAVYFTDTDTGKQGGMAYYHIGDELRLYAGETQKMALNSDGTTINNGSLFVADKITHNGDTNTHIRFPAADTFSVETAGSERLRITSAGKVGIGTDNPVGGASSGMFEIYNSAHAKNRVAITVNEAQNNAGRIDFKAATGSFSSTNVQASVEGIITNSSGALTGDLVFHTNAGDSLTEKLRIASDGKVHFGNQTAVGANGYILKETSGDYKFNIFASSSTTTNRIITFNSRSNVEAMRIAADGNLALGGTNTSAYSGHTNFFIGGMGNLYAEKTAASGSSLSLSNNAYINSSGNWVYRTTGKATNIYQYNGLIGFRTAASGSAGGTISWAERLTIDHNHNIYIWGAQTGNNRGILYNGASYFGIYGSSDGSTHRELRFHSAGGSASERMRITSTSVQVLNTSGKMIDCRTSATTGNCWIALSESDGTNKGYFGYGSSSNEQLYIVQQESADITIYNGSASRWYFKTDGQLNSATDGAINVHGGSGNHPNDAIIYCDKTSSADWAISANANTTDYGIYTRVANSAAYGIGVYDHTNSAWRFRVNGAGTIFATTTTISSISDQRLKENIVDANSQWDDIKGLRFRNFKWKADSGYADGKTYLGLISQEVETISPGLVEINAQTKEDIENGVTDPEYKNVKYSIVWMKAMKALQEAQARIETLEAKVATLEGS